MPATAARSCCPHTPFLAPPAATAGWSAGHTRSAPPCRTWRSWTWWTSSYRCTEQVGVGRGGPPPDCSSGKFGLWDLGLSIFRWPCYLGFAFCVWSCYCPTTKAGAAESWSLTGSQAAQLELLDGTGQMPISQLLSRHRVRWLGHAARKPETTIVNQLLHADNIPGRPRPVGRPHYTWMDGTMQDLNALGPRLQLDLL